jgi:hypothetical protein
MRLVAGAATLERIREQGGALYVSPRAHRCCGGRSWSLAASTTRPDRDVDLLHREAGIAIFATHGLVRPLELHVELDRCGRVAAYWNGQAFVG